MQENLQSDQAVSSVVMLRILKILQLWTPEKML